MKRKNMFHFGFGNGTSDNLFREKRLAYRAADEGATPVPREGAEAPEESLEVKSTKSLLGAIFDYVEEEDEAGRDVDLDVTGMDDPGKFLKENPFSKDLIDAFGRITTVKFTSIERVRDENKIILHYPEADQEITDEKYFGLIWNELEIQLRPFLEENKIDAAALRKAAEQGSIQSRYLWELLRQVDKDGFDAVDSETKEAALVDLTAGMTPETVEERRKMRRDLEADTTPTERARVGLETLKVDVKAPDYDDVFKIKEGPDKVGEKLEKFIEDNNSAGYHEQTEATIVDEITTGVLFEKLKDVNPKAWDHVHPAGVDIIYNDLQKVGVRTGKNKDFYDKMFSILRKAADPEKNPYRLREDYPRIMEWIADPMSHINDIRALDDFGSALASAYEHLWYLKGMLLAMDKKKLDSLQQQTDLDSDKVVDTVKDFVGDNIEKFKKSIQEGDWGTAALYGVGVWAIYKTLKKVAGGGEKGEGRLAKWLTYGAAGYCGYVFAKNAGYDVLKLAGFKRADAEVKGTPMEALFRVIKEHPELSEEEKDISADTVMRMSEVNLGTIDQAFLESRSDPETSGLSFIHPKKFGSLFPIAGQWPFDARTIGERGIGDYIGAPNVKLTANQEAYVKLGHELYKIAYALRMAYQDTLMKDHPQYKNVRYEDAIKRGGGLGKVRHFCFALTPYAPDEMEKSLLSGYSKEKAEKELKGLFPEGVGYALHDELATGHIKGYLKGYPVVFVRTANGYRVYMKQQYKNPSAPGKNFLGEIPVKEGPARISAAQKVVAGIDARMLELLEGVLIEDNIKFTKETLKYEPTEGGRWVCGIQLPEDDEYDVKQTESKVYISILPEGEGVSFEFEGGTVVTLTELTKSMHPKALSIIPRMTTQPEFQILQAISKSLTIDDDVSGDGKFVLILPNGLDVEVIYTKKDGEDGKFGIDPEDQKFLVQNPLFARTYVEALKGDARLKKMMKEFTDFLDSAPEGFFEHFFRSVPNWVTEFKLSDMDRGISIDDFKGSIGEGKAIALFEAQQDLLMAQVTHTLRKSTDMESAYRDVSSVVAPALDKFQTIFDAFSSSTSMKESEGDNWAKQDFDQLVILPMLAVGTKSPTYASWYRFAATKILSYPGVSRTMGKQLLAAYSFYTVPTDDPELDSVDLSDRTTPKSIKFLQYSSYNEYVLGEVLKWLQLNPDSSYGPDPEGLHLIPVSSFDAKTSHPSFEFIDQREVIRMTRNYVTFDKYIAEIDSFGTGPEAEAERNVYRAFVRDEDLILPRADVDIKITSRADVERFEKIAGTGPLTPGTTIVHAENIKMTEMEDYFYNKIHELFAYIREEYGRKAITTAFDELMRGVDPAFKIEFENSSEGYVVKIDYGHGTSSRSEPFSSDQTALDQIIYDMEGSEFITGTLTRSKQEAALKSRVKEMLDHVLDERNFYIYFDKITVGDRLKEIVKTIEDWWKVNF